jgi:hypothetical protein
MALPVNPKIFKKRIDVSWEEVVHNYFKDKNYLQHGKRLKLRKGLI